MSTQSIGRWVLRKFQEMGRVITIEEAVAKYKIDDMILVSRNSEPHNYVKEYTNTLQASQPSKVKAGLQVQSKEVLKSTGKKRGKHMEYEKVRKFTGVKLDLAIFKTQKYRITGNDRIHSNGEILISQ